jgi:hypothetical protein
MSHGTDGRDMRARAAETKFVVNRSLGEIIRVWARERLSADPHGAVAFGDQYRTASVYFDTSGYDVFYRRGSFARSKYRARRYECGDAVFLERKLTRPGLVTKRRTRVGVEALASIERADGLDVGRWFRRRVLVRGLRPVCQLSYLRTARVATTAEGPVRLTLDEDVRALPTREWAFSSEVGTPVLEREIIVELKYAGGMPAVFRALVEQFGLVPQSASKYRLGVVALGYAPAVPAVENAQR